MQSTDITGYIYNLAKVTNAAFTSTYNQKFNVSAVSKHIVHVCIPAV